jgi:uncharacterized protein YdiU (UPF0061 family)
MAQKLGFTTQPSYAFDENDHNLVNEFYELMHQSGNDFTNTFRALCEVNLVDDETLLSSIMANASPLDALLKSKAGRYSGDPRIRHIYD